ncbi:retrotransposon protein, putative, ty1-copia subclass [Tanacetum coccineum]
MLLVLFTWGTGSNGGNGNVNDYTIPSVSVDSGNAVKEVVSPIAVDEIMKKERLSPLMETTDLGSYPPLPTPGTTTGGTTPGKSSYANVTNKPCGKKANFRTLFTSGGNGIDVVIPVEFIRAIRLFPFQFSSMEGLNSMLENGPWFICNNPLILKKWHPDVNLLKEDVGTVPVWVKLHGVPVMTFSEDGLSVIATKLGTPLMIDSYTSDMYMQPWGRSSYARAMIKLRADVELKDNIVAVMPKITGEGYYTCNIRVEYEWKPPRCACCKVFEHVQEECPKNIGTCATKNLKKTSQTPKGIPVGQKMGFKPKQVFHPVSKKSTANTYGKKMNNSESTKEVSKSNPFEVRTSVDNDVDLGTNGGISNSADKGTVNVSSSNTPIAEKIDKIERQIREGKFRLSTSGKDGSDKGYRTNSLLEQWRDSYLDNDDYDPYNDDMYKNHDMSEHLQSIFHDLDITVRPSSSPLPRRLPQRARLPG